MTLDLERAWICIDCDAIGNDARRCERCGSVAVHPVASWIIPAAEGSQESQKAEALPYQMASS